MARKSMNELLQQSADSLPDNITGEISPEDVRGMFDDLINSIKPAYAYLQIIAERDLDVGTAPVLMVFDTAYDSDSSETTTQVPASTIIRSEKGTSTLRFFTDAIIGNGVAVTFMLMKDGLPTSWVQSLTGDGNNDPVSCSFSAITYSDTPATYSIEVSCQNNDTISLSNSGLVLVIEPVTSFV